MITMSTTRPGILLLSLFSMLLMTSMVITDTVSADRRGRRDDDRSDRRYKQQKERGDSRSNRGRRRVVSPPPFREGHVVSRLPRGYRRVWHNREPYFYDRGVFYRPGPSGYRVVRGPVGALVVSLPVGHTRIWVGGEFYFTYGGIFYRRAPSGYVVVEAPPAVIVDETAPVIIQPPETFSGQAAVTVDLLNVRSGPALSHSIVYQIQRGYVLDIHGKSGGWLFVELPNGEYGWVMSEYTQFLKIPGAG